MDDSINIGAWRVEPASNRIVNGNRRHQLEPRIMAVLMRLAEQRGSVVRRSDLLDDVWGEVVVNEDALTRAISDLRQLLGDDPSAPRYIETIRGVGYRLIAPVGPATKPVLHDIAETESLREADSTLRLSSIGVVALVVMLATGAGWALLGSHREADLPDIPEIVPLTSDPGFERHPATAPDGSRVVYSSGDDYWEEEFDLYVKQPGTEARLQLTDLAGYEAHAAWSPDGQTVAFAHLDSTGHTSLKTVAGIGGPVKTLADANSWVVGLDWSPDGKEVAFAERGADGQHGYGISILDIETGQRTYATTAHAFSLDILPVYSPDGSHIAFIRSTLTGLGDLYIMPAAGGTPRRITNRQARIRDLAWSPDGRALLYITDHPGSSRIRRISIDSKRTRPVHAASWGVESLDIVPGRLVFEEAATDSDIWQLTPSDGETPARLIASTQWESDPAFSPDSRRLAFMSNRSGYSEIWVANADGSSPLQLTHFEGAPVSKPHWSPDGSRIAFFAENGEGGGIYVVSAEGGAVRRIGAAMASAVVSNWSGDGTRIYYATDEKGLWDIWAISVEGGARSRITSEGGLSAAESSDGRYLYVTRPDEDGLWRQPVAGGKAVKVHDRPHRWAWDNWGLQGDHLYYLDIQGGSRVIMQSDLSEALPHVLARLPERRLYAGITLAPDGSRLVFSELRHQGSDLKTAAW